MKNLKCLFRGGHALCRSYVGFGMEGGGFDFDAGVASDSQGEGREAAEPLSEGQIVKLENILKGRNYQLYPQGVPVVNQSSVGGLYGKFAKTMCKENENSFNVVEGDNVKIESYLKGKYEIKLSRHDDRTWAQFVPKNALEVTLTPETVVQEVPSDTREGVHRPSDESHAVAPSGPEAVGHEGPGVTEAQDTPIEPQYDGSAPAATVDAGGSEKVYSDYESKRQAYTTYRGASKNYLIDFSAPAVRGKEKTIGLRDLFDDPYLKVVIGKKQPGRVGRAGQELFVKRDADGNYYHLNEEGKKIKATIFTDDVVAQIDRNVYNQGVVYSEDMKDIVAKERGVLGNEKMALVRERLKSKGASPEALFAFEQAYGRSSTEIKKFIEDLRNDKDMEEPMDVRNPNTWTIVHQHLMSLGSAYYSAEYARAFQKYVKTMGDFPEVANVTSAAELAEQIGYLELELSETVESNDLEHTEASQELEGLKRDFTQYSRQDRIYVDKRIRKLESVINAIENGETDKGVKISLLQRKLEMAKKKYDEMKSEKKPQVVAMLGEMRIGKKRE